MFSKQALALLNGYQGIFRLARGILRDFLVAGAKDLT
jgi:hypothetical protein